jgi:hypothetical protein
MVLYGLPVVLNKTHFQLFLIKIPKKKKKKKIGKKLN